MGLLSGLFGSGSKTTTVDPWSKMPQWMKDSYEGDIKFRNKLMKQAKNLGKPKTAGLTGTERTAFKGFKGDAREVGALGDRAVNNVNQARLAIGDFDPAFEFGEFDAGYDPADPYTGQRLTDMIGSENFEDGYIGDVVDTTLAGMDRRQASDDVRRRLEQGRTGGFANTRSAVEDAVARSLYNMDRAETEAGLRSDATRYGDEMLLEQAGMLDASDLERADFAEGQARCGAEMTMDELLALQNDRQFMSNADREVQQAIFDARMDVGDAYDGMADSALARGIAKYDIRNRYGATKRGIRQDRMDAKRENLGWLAASSGVRTLSARHLRQAARPSRRRARSSRLLAWGHRWLVRGWRRMRT